MSVPSNSGAAPAVSDDAQAAGSDDAQVGGAGALPPASRDGVGIGGSGSWVTGGMSGESKMACNGEELVLT